MVTPDWQKVKGIVFEALSLPEDARARYVDAECSLDPALRSEVEALLGSYESGFLEASVLEDRPPRSGRTPSLFEPGYRFDQYEIIKLLGRGGMGEVYLANDTSLDRLIAIKIIHNDSGLADDASARLLHEARAVAKVEHPSICSVYEVGEADGHPFIAMQYVVGETLDRLIANGLVTHDDAISYARQIAAALAKAHSHDLVHRDVKPANVIVDAEKQLKVLDFGLAERLRRDADQTGTTDAGLIAGTIAYMSPEHLRGEEAGFQTDIWGLGVVIYQMFTGRMPFVGYSRAELIDKILVENYDEIKELAGKKLEGVDRILKRALAKDKHLRYASIDELDVDLSMLEKAFDEETLKRGRAKWYVASAVIVLTLIAAFTGLFLRTKTDRNDVFPERPGGGYKMSSVYSVKRPGGGAISDLSFSPNGELLAFTFSATGNSSIQVIPVGGGAPYRLTKVENPMEYSPVWSPDGSRIAYVSVTGGKSAVWAVDTNSGNPEPIVDLPSDSAVPALRKWSNDGSRLYFDDGRGPRSIDLTSGSLSVLDISGVGGRAIRGFSISDDESTLLLNTSNNGKEELWIKTLGNGAARQITGTWPRNGPPELLPKGDGYTYSADENGTFQIYVRALDGSPPRQITFSNFSASSPVASHKGKSIAYISNVDSANIFRTNVLTGEHQMLTGKVNMQLFPKVSPDGRYLAYQMVNESSKLLSSRLQIDSLAAGATQPIAMLDGSGCCIEWSPTSEAIALVRRAGTEFNLFRFDIGTRVETQLTTGGIALPPISNTPYGFHWTPFQWAPAGDRLAFAARRSGPESIFTVALASDEIEIDKGEEKRQRVSPKWAPDANAIAFLDLSVSRGSNTRVMVSSGGETVSIAEFETKVMLLDWSQKGDGVYVAAAREGSYDIIFIPTNAAVSRRMLTSLKNAKPHGISISPDKKAISYSVFRNQVENLCVLTFSTMKERCLTSNDDPTLFYSGTTWSPDSTSLLYSRQSGGIEISLITREN